MPRALPLIAAVLALAVPTGAQAQLPAGLTSDNVAFVKNFVRHFDTAGGRLVGGYYYVTTERDLSIYDVKDPENPTLTGNVLFESFGEPTFTEEDPDTNGRILIVSNTDFFVYDVSDKANPHIIGRLPGVEQHTFSCVLDCTYAYGSNGAIVDLRDPANPKLAGSWVEDLQPSPSSFHDVTEVSPGIVVSASTPLVMMDVRPNPLKPVVLATGKTPGFAHAALWPHAGTDDFLLAGGESIGPQCAGGTDSTFMTFDTRGWAGTKTFNLLSEFRLETGIILDGRMVDSTWCVHWFAEHPSFANGGLVAIAWYEQGVRFLKVDAAGKIEEIGYWLPITGQSSDVDWITDRVVYVADYLRGVDILKFTGTIPPAFPHPPAAPTPAPVAVPATPHPTFDALVALPSAKRCVRAKTFRVRIKRVARDPAARATLRVNGRRVAGASGAALKRGLRAKRLPRGRFSIQVEVRTRSGFKTAGKRTYRGC